MQLIFQKKSSIMHFILMMCCISVRQKNKNDSWYITLS